MTARSVIDVMLGEAVSGTRAERYEDMRAIASAIENRARQLGVTPEEVVGVQSEFNAYGKSLPKGVAAYRDLAEQALADVRKNGPVHTGTFYATPSATKNLPKGLSRVASTTGHQYFTDPQNRSIRTARGFRTPSAQPATATAFAAALEQTSAQRAIRGGLLGGSVPTPSAAPRGGLLADYQPSPFGGRVTGMVPTPTAAPRDLVPTVTNGVASARAAPEAARFGTNLPMQAPRAMLDRYAETREGIRGSRVAPQSVTAGLAPTPQQEANLRDRLGPVEPARQWSPVVADRLSRQPETVRPGGLGLLGVSPAAAAEMPASPAPVSSGFAGRVGSPRSLEGRSLAGLLDPALNLAAPTASVPPGSLLGPSRIPSPTFAQRPGPITTSRTVGPAPTVAATPQRVSVATPSQPAAPAPARSYASQAAPAATPTAQEERTAKPERSWQQKSAVIAGSLLGGVVAGPVGGLLAGALANRAVNQGLLAGTQQQRAGNGYASSLPEAPGRGFDRKATRSEMETIDRMNRENGSGGISKSTRDAIGRAEKSGKGGFW